MSNSPLKIRFFAPASYSSNLSSPWLESLQDVQCEDYSLRQNVDGFSGSSMERVHELKHCLMNEGFYMAQRGGWGCLQLMQHYSTSCEWSSIGSGKVQFCGFSDLTALLNFLSQKGLASCFHGPMFDWPKTSQNLHYLRESFESLCIRREDYCTRIEGEVVNGDLVQGPLIGGNLSVLLATFGTPFEPDFKGKVLFLEEISEPSYRVDRMLTQLSLKRDFKDLHGILFGAFTDCSVSPVDSMDLPVGKLIERFVSRLEVPCINGVPTGHLNDFLVLPLETDSSWTQTSDGIEVRLAAKGKQESS